MSSFENHQVFVHGFMPAFIVRGRAYHLAGPNQTEPQY